MLIGKLFLPLALPGLAMVGLGLVAVVNGAYNLIEVVAIVVGLMVIAIAGVFTIRSNVAKIWREQAEGEKARNADLVEQLAEQRLAAAEDLAKVKLEATDLREQLQHAQSELNAASTRTDLTPVLAVLHEILATVKVQQQ